MVAFKTVIASALFFAASAVAAPLAERASSSGPGTYYYQNGNPGACGWWKSDSDYIVAINSGEYNGGANCGKKIYLKNNQNGKTATAMVADLCPSCGGDGYSGIDMSEALFEALGSKEQGVLPVSWWY